MSSMTVKVDRTAIKWTTYLAAAVGVAGVGFVIGIASYVNDNTSANCDFEKFTQQVSQFGQNDNGQVDCVLNNWSVRRGVRGLAIAFGFTEALVAAALIPTYLAIGDMFGSRLTEMRFAVPAIVAAAALTIWELITLIGEITVADWLAGPTWNLSGDGVRALTITYFVSRGANLWLFALDTLLTGCAVIAIAVATFRYGYLPRWHGWLGFVLGAISILDFILELARFANWGLLSVIDSIITAALGFILFPIWIIVVGCYINNFEFAPDTRMSLMSDERSAASAAADRDLGASSTVRDEHL